MNIVSKRIFGALLLAALTLPGVPLFSQRTLTLEDCRKMAIESNKDLDQARTQVEMAQYDKNIALANYFPNISATGAYLYNSGDVALIGDDLSTALTSSGTLLQAGFQQKLQTLQQVIASNPALAREYMSSPLMQTLVGSLSQTDVSQAINSIGAEVDKALHPDLHNIFAGSVSLTQPVFMGGKIVAANRIARLAEELSRARYDQKYQEILVAVDSDYWQVVSVAGKLKLATSYADLLHGMQKNVEIAEQEGIATKSDVLQIKVKANEADMLKTKAENGLRLAKMLLCKETGLPLDTEIILADEGMDDIPAPVNGEDRDMDTIYENRPEIRSLSLAGDIYDGKADMVRADLLPKVAAVANYVVTNPNISNGFDKSFKGFFTAGIVVNVPIFHAFEGQNKLRKARAEATLYDSRLEDARNMINLQVTKLREERDEAWEKYSMTRSNLAAAEENLRTATAGFEAGVIDATTALAAQTAWLEAHSSFIDAGIELQMNNVNLRKAQGEYVSDIYVNEK